MRPEVSPFLHAPSGTFCYVVHDPGTRAGVIVDPCLDFDAKSGRTGTASAAAVVEHVRRSELRIDWILETHAHADHLSAAAWLKSQLPGARVGIGAGICAVQATFRTVFNLGEQFPVDGRQFDHLFKDEERLPVGGIEGRVIATPGHTNDSVSYLIGDALFPGDTLFLPDSGTARCDFPGGSAVRLYDSIQRLYRLPDSTRVFVCHDYGQEGRSIACETSIGAEKQGNIHLQHDTPAQEFVRVREARDRTLDMPNLLLPSLQVNIRAGALPEPESNGVRYLKLPIDRF